MDTLTRPSTSLFDVYLRLRPSVTAGAERFLDVETSELSEWPKHITIKPPSNDHRKRAVEKFAFTRVFEENASQLDIFQGTGILALLDGVLGSEGRGRDGLLATLGVTGSGKSHTILGSKSQRGLTQMALDVLFQSISHNVVHPSCANSIFPSLAASDVSEAQIVTAGMFLDAVYGDGQSVRGSSSRAQTPMMDASFLSMPSSSKQRMPRPSALPQSPNLEGFEAPIDRAAEYVLVVSMYEVYNDRIYDLLGGTMPGAKGAAPKRRALLFKSTELSPDRKVVAGLRKVVCCTLDEALMILETGLIERKVAGTGSNAVSSRSHGFFCVEVKKRNRIQKGRWESSTLTIVDLAGSERARNAKTAGATLAEAGKINESLMYLGQCMQMQSDSHDGTKHIVPFRQCKLTELLFSNSFPSTSLHHAQSHNTHHRNPQKAIMMVTADATGDFNATSQILRYSALAREVTVPRIPSVTSTILSGPAQGHQHPRPGTSGSSSGSGYNVGSSGRNTPSRSVSHHHLADELELAQLDLARLETDVDILSLQLDEERQRREMAETCWAAGEERFAILEQEIRDECFAEAAALMETERRRWKAIWDEEADRNDERVDAKISILTRGIVLEDEDAAVGPSIAMPGTVAVAAADAARLAELEDENSRLRHKIEMLEREKLLQTPTQPAKKQRVLKARKWEAEVSLTDD